MAGCNKDQKLAAIIIPAAKPCIEFKIKDSSFAWLPAAIGFLLGGLFIRALDLVIPHIHPNTSDENQFHEGVGTKKLNKNTLLVLAITLHNIPVYCVT